ncbi:kinase-like domain-containing protein [Pavlovales sp. CCMP2436]|nr:kinase-like domain-containing protein [Pavlovales sp. CCMP2436]
MRELEIEPKRMPADPDLDELDQPASKRARFQELSNGDSHYKPSASLGQGTYAVVWRAMCVKGEKEGTEFAIKRFKAQHMTPPRVQNEADMLMACKGGATVVELLSICRSNERLAFVLPYFPHDSFRLDSPAARASFPQENIHSFDIQHTLTYMGGIFEALAHVHDCRVLHRDVKVKHCVWPVAARVRDRVRVGSRLGLGLGLGLCEAQAAFRRGGDREGWEGGGERESEKEAYLLT